MEIKKKQLDDFISGWNISQRCNFIFSGNRSIIKNGKLSCDTVVSPNILPVKNGDTVYCKTDMLFILRDHLLKEKKSIHLITHDSDFPIEKKLFNAINDSCDIISWRGININYNHKKLSSIPIGLANDYCPITLKSSDIMNIKEVEPKKLIYLNFNKQTNPQERESLYFHFKDTDTITVRNPKDIKDKNNYIEELIQHKFCMCPPGNGIDTHRVWECLYLGIIPVVKKCINISFFEDLPILIVENFTDLVGEEKHLEKIYVEYHSKNWNLDKLTVGYWL